MAIFDKETLALKPLAWGSAALKKATLTGKAAIKAVEAMEGRKLTANEAAIVLEEGFVPVPYLDGKGVPTIGAGLTGKWMKKSFLDAYDAHASKITDRIDNFEQLPEALQIRLIGSAYRGGITGSAKTIGLINKGKYSEAALEFLDNDEYRDKKTDAGVKDRMKALSLELARTQDTDTPTAASQPVSEVLPEEQPNAKPSDNTSQEFSKEELAFIEEQVAARQEDVAGLEFALSKEDAVGSLGGKFTAEEEAFIAEQVAARSAEVHPNTIANREAGRTVEGKAGREERIDALQKKELEDAAIDNLF